MDRKLFLVLAVTGIVTIPAVAGAGTVLGVGSLPTEEGGTVSPLVLKRADGAWRQIVLDAPDGLALLGVSFSSADTAWVVGSWGDDAPALLRSVDGGETWQDLAPELPSAMAIGDRLTSVAFLDDSTGWIAGMPRGMPHGPSLASSVDGGKSWHAIEVARHLMGYADVAVRSGELVAYKKDGSGTRLESVSEVSSAGDALVSPELESEGFSPSLITVAGNREWVVGETYREDTRFDGKVTLSIPDLPTIFSRTVGGAWARQDVPFEGRGTLRRAHFRDEVAGLAGGKNLREPTKPLVFATLDGGTTWVESALPAETEGTYTATLTRGSGATGWVVARRIGGKGIGFLLLETSDGGMTWHVATTGFEDTGMVHALAEGPTS